VHARHGTHGDRLDYVGIAVLIMTSFIPWIYYGFYCRREPKLVYTGMIVLLGVACIYISLDDTFSHAGYKALRAAVFIAISASGAIPCVHFWITDGYAALIHEANLVKMMIMCAFYLVGTFFYALRIPERWWPGKFDIWVRAAHASLTAVVCSFNRIKSSM
jgi:adiponectin receptor